MKVFYQNYDRDNNDQGINTQLKSDRSQLRNYNQVSSYDLRQNDQPSAKATQKTQDVCGLTNKCTPKAGNLLLGRKTFLQSSSTCGLEKPVLYCVLSKPTIGLKKSKSGFKVAFDSDNEVNNRVKRYIENNEVCGVCDSFRPFEEDKNSHRIENVVNGEPSKVRSQKWWQSESNKDRVFIQFDLESEYIFSHFYMKFKTFRPAAMVVEKSIDYGLTWKPIAYFASDCRRSFPNVSNRPRSHPRDVNCDTRYSSIEPSTGGELIFKVLPPQITQNKDPYSDEILPLIKLTNLRFNFTKLHRLGDEAFQESSEESTLTKYYYAIYEINVGGSCFCYGHASRCTKLEGMEYDVDNENDMVHGQCECKHNTGGSNCEKCLPLYNDKPWAAATSNAVNECKKCECHDHAATCHFDRELFEQSGGVSGGICDDCQHNTMGKNCDTCKIGFWKDPSVPINHTEICKRK